MLDILTSLSFDTLLWATIGMALGIFLGALPGFGGSSALAIVLPIAITLSLGAAASEVLETRNEIGWLPLRSVPRKLFLPGPSGWLGLLCGLLQTAWKK